MCSVLASGQYPVQLGGDPGVHSLVVGLSTPEPSADHPDQGEPPVLLDHQGGARVSLAVSAAQIILSETAPL